MERNRLALTYVGQPRAAAVLRTAALGGGATAASPAAASGSAAGALLLRGSAASAAATTMSHNVDATGTGLFAMGNGGVGFGEGSLHGSEARGAGGSGSMPSKPAAAAGAAVAWGPGPAALGLPVLCYWQALALALDPLAPLRCPSALLCDFLGERSAARCSVTGVMPPGVVGRVSGAVMAGLAYMVAWRRRGESCVSTGKMHGGWGHSLADLARGLCGFLAYCHRALQAARRGCEVAGWRGRQAAGACARLPCTANFA